LRNSTSICRAYQDLEAVLQNDLLILGGGCAGLSLARQLATLGERCPQTAIIESRHTYTNDRTWCFWKESSAQLTHLVSHRWPSVSVSAHGNLASVDCRAAPYVMIPSAVFYDESIRILSEAPSIQLETGVTVLTEPRKVGSEWHVETSAGLRSACRIVDTRATVTPRPGAALLWQSFVGHEIETSEPVFQPDVAELMHFHAVSGGGILFFYLLPFAPNRALLEATLFAVEPLGPDTFHEEIQAFIARRVHGASYTILRSEHGILPMGMSPPSVHPDASYVKAGLFSGSARSSSGYAFQRIQRWAVTCAAALSTGRLPVSHPRDPALLRAMDTLFLHVLRRRPELAPEIFLALFQKVDIAILVRFMSDRATLADCAAIVSALPSGPFLREIFPALKSSYLS
jgi:lycopene beta-cyclase